MAVQTRCETQLSDSYWKYLRALINLWVSNTKKWSNVGKRGSRYKVLTHISHTRCRFDATIANTPPPTTMLTQKHTLLQNVYMRSLALLSFWENWKIQRWVTACEYLLDATVDYKNTNSNYIKPNSITIPPPSHDFTNYSMQAPGLLYCLPPCDKHSMIAGNQPKTTTRDETIPDRWSPAEGQKPE